MLSSPFFYLILINFFICYWALWLVLGLIILLGLSSIWRVLGKFKMLNGRFTNIFILIMFSSIIRKVLGFILILKMYLSLNLLFLTLLIVRTFWIYGLILIVYGWRVNKLHERFLLDLTERVRLNKRLFFVLRLILVTIGSCNRNRAILLVL